MNLKKLCVLSVFCAQGFASVSDELVKPIFADKLMCEIQIDNAKELAQFAVELSSKINSAYKIYGKATQNLKNDSDEISLSIIDTKDAFKPDRDFALKTIPTVIANCVLRQGKFHPDKIVNGLVVVFPKTEAELLRQEYWDAVILYNYVYGMIYGSLKDIGEQVPPEEDDGSLNENGEQALIEEEYDVKLIGNKVVEQYGNQYKKEIDKSVATIEEYATALNLRSFLYDIELSDAVQEPYLKINKLPYINTINFTGTNDKAYPHFTFSLVFKNGDRIEQLHVKYFVCAYSRFMPPIGCMSLTKTTEDELIASLETFTINEYLERVKGNSWTYQANVKHPASSQGTTSNAPIKLIECGKIELGVPDILELTPELYKKTSLVQTQWNFDKLKGVYKLIDLSFNEELLKHKFLPPDGYSDFLLRFPKKYNGHPVIIDDKLEERIMGGLIHYAYENLGNFNMQWSEGTDNKGIKVNTPYPQKTIKEMAYVYAKVRLKKKDNWKEYFLQ